MLKLMMAAIGCSLSLNALAQFSIGGTVRDAKTKELLTGATVQLENQKRYAVTDEQGRFELKSIPGGAQDVLIKFLGYQDLHQQVNVTGNTQIEIALEESTQLTDEVVVSATRVSEKSPTTFSNLNRIVIQKQNFGQDLPFILNWSPSVVTTSDAGAGVGYTGMRIRGSDATRINVTINGIPLNDSESQGVYWVDVPDIATSTQSIQIQRGVGTSTNGAGAFGASINLQTNTRNDKPYADVINSYGSFNTQRHTFGVGTGLINDKFVFDGRMSLINSNGFIDRAASDLKSFYLSGGYYGKKTMIKAIVFGGREVTYQSWYGVPQSRLNNDTNGMLETAAAEGWNTDQTNNLLNSNSRTFNIYDYKNQVDNYGQNHFQLHTSHRFTDFLSANASLHYTHGNGYYEEFRYDDSFSNYGLPNAIIGNDTLKSSDLVRKRWLDNRFYGITYSVNYEKEKLTSVIGGALNRYDGDHYGEITWAKVAINAPKDYRYYFNNGDKRDFNIFWKNSYQFTDDLTAFVDLQYRMISYRASGKENKQDEFSVDVKYNFFNPKFGLTYTLSPEQNLYASYSIANREPMRDDYVDAGSGAAPKSEMLRDLETGWRLRKNRFTFNANYYLMSYRNQLVLTGKLSDTGASIRTNVDNSYRTGIELDGSIRISSKLFWNANLTLSQNKIQNFNEVLYNYGTNFDEYNEVQKSYKKSDISFSPNIIAGSGFTYRPFQSFDVTLLTKYVGKQFLDNTSNENRKIDAYFINDVRFTYVWKPSFLRELSLSLLLNNILDVKYASNGYTYGYFGGSTEYRQNYYYPQAGRNFLLMAAIRF